MQAKQDTERIYPSCQYYRNISSKEHTSALVPFTIEGTPSPL